MSGKVVEAQNIAVDGLLETDGSNKCLLRCENSKCKSRVLPPGKGCYTQEISRELHVVRKKHVEEGITSENVGQWYVVNDMFDFDNIGFTKLAAGIDVKYLICADCEIGPIGWQDSDTKKCYVALSRISHDQ